MALAQVGQRVGPADPLDGLRADHPRVLATRSTWESIAERRSREPELDQVATLLIRHAERALAQPPLQRVVVGRRLLGKSREAMWRVWAHAAAWRLTREARFLEGARREMLAMAEFSDWNPSHFLDVAEMTAGVAVGYDWLHEALDAETRQRIRAAIVRLALQPALQDGADTWFYRARHNWNQVCIGGLTLGALAVANDEPDIAREFLTRARQHIGNGLGPYAPDGVYPEGPGYWLYGTGYQVLMIEALRSALGTDWDLPSAPGFLRSSDFALQMTGPTGLPFNYADNRPTVQIDPLWLWFARERPAPYLAHPVRVQVRSWLHEPLSLHRVRPLVMSLLWWPLPDDSTCVPPATFWTGQGTNPVAVWRTRWDDPNAVFFAIKGGGAAVSHGHMDAGSFVLDALGVRWAEDLGLQDYHELESQGVRLWDGRPGGQRWEVFRLNNHSHNTLTIDDELHDARGLALLVRADEQGAELELSPVFEGQARRVVRRVRWHGHGGVELEDELEGLRPGARIRWAMVTRAEPRVTPPRVHLTLEGRKLDLEYGPTDWVPNVVSIEKPGGFNAENPGRRRVELHGVADGEGRAQIRVRLVPRHP